MRWLNFFGGDRKLKVKNTQKKEKGRSVQELLGIKTFTKYGLATTKGELLFYLVSETTSSKVYGDKE